MPPSNVIASRRSLDHPPRRLARPGSGRSTEEAYFAGFDLRGRAESRRRPAARSRSIPSSNTSKSQHSGPTCMPRNFPTRKCAAMITRPCGAALSNSRPALRNRFSLLRAIVFLCCATFLVATALPARDRAVAPFDGGSHHATAVSWADGDTPWADADSIVTVPIVAVVAVPPDLNIDALGHLEVLSLGRSSRRRSRQHRCGCRQDKSDLHHQASSLGLMPPARVIAGPRAHLTSILCLLRGCPVGVRG
jgi:hypothetical protein